MCGGSRRCAEAGCIGAAAGAGPSFLSNGWFSGRVGLWLHGASCTYIRPQPTPLAACTLLTSAVCWRLRRASRRLLRAFESSWAYRRLLVPVVRCAPHGESVGPQRAVPPAWWAALLEQVPSTLLSAFQKTKKMCRVYLHHLIFHANTLDALIRNRCGASVGRTDCNVFRVSSP